VRLSLAVMILQSSYLFDDSSGFTTVSTSRPPPLSQPVSIRRRSPRCRRILYSSDLEASTTGENSHEVAAEQQEVYFSPNPVTNEEYGIDDVNEVDTENSLNEYSFFDEAIIYVKAGSGGQGASVFKKGNKGQNSIPDGGNGGRGGDVVMVSDDSLNTLAGLTNAWRPNAFGGGGAARQNARFRFMSFTAENGADGGRGYRNGKYGKEVVIRVPPGTFVQEEVDIKEWDEEAGKEIVVRTECYDIGSVDLEFNQQLVVAVGGEGGEGSGAVGNKGRGVKRARTGPVGGERKRLKLTLKVVADVALVAVPNAGKSTTLASVTRAKPKISNYPFTTLIPNLGVWVPQEALYGEETTRTRGSGSKGLILCDIPGLVSGAADGRGLGHAFLRHVERCHVILHIIDATSADPIGDFKMINKELMRYGTGKLAQMPQVVVVNKVDVWEDENKEDWEKGLQTKMSRDELQKSLTEAMAHTRLMWMSAKEKDGVDDLMKRLSAFVTKVKETERERLVEI